MEKILVPTDLTATAELGLQLAVEIAKRSQATISLVNFTRHPFGRTFSAMGDLYAQVDPEQDLYTVKLLRANSDKLAELAARYSSEQVAIEYAIVDDELKDGVDEYLNREYIDLVVMGTSGEETAKEAFTGNHTEQVIKIATCPVLSVRDGFKVSDFDNIVLAINVIDDQKVGFGLSTLRDLAECFGAHVNLVHMSTGKHELGYLNDYFVRVAIDAGFTDYSVTILEEDDHAEGVIDFARKVKAGLIAVIKNSNDGIFRIFSNHFSDRLVKEVGRPVFTYNLQNA